MISRVAEHCFWMARYLERAENTARVLEVNHTLLLDFHVPVEQQWRPLLIITGIHDYTDEPTAENVQELHDLGPRTTRSASRRRWRAARENARIIREVICAEMWERMNFYHLWMQGAGGAASCTTRNRSEFYTQMRRINQLIHGIADGTMSHGEAWEFFKLGTYLERASQTARILDVKYHILLPKVEDVGSRRQRPLGRDPDELLGVRAVPQEAAAGAVDPATAVAEFLIFDEQFPRSIRRCLWECESAAAAAAGNPVGREPDRAGAAARGPDRLARRADDRRRDPRRAARDAHARRRFGPRIGEAIHATFFAADVPARRGPTQTAGADAEPVAHGSRAVATGAQTSAVAYTRSRIGHEEPDMGIRVALNHVTKYTYDRPVTLHPHVVRLRPAPHARTPIPSYSLTRRADAALPELAAGPVQQLPRPARVPEAGDANWSSPSIWSPS